MLQGISWHENLHHGKGHDALQFIPLWQHQIMLRFMANINTTWHHEENRFSDLVKIRVDMCSSFYQIDMLDSRINYDAKPIHANYWHNMIEHNMLYNTSHCGNTKRAIDQ